MIRGKRKTLPLAAEGNIQNMSLCSWTHPMLLEELQYLSRELVRNQPDMFKQQFGITKYLPNISRCCYSINIIIAIISSSNSYYYWLLLVIIFTVVPLRNSLSRPECHCNMHCNAVTMTIFLCLPVCFG